MFVFLLVYACMIIPDMKPICRNEHVKHESVLQILHSFSIILFWLWTRGQSRDSYMNPIINILIGGMVACNWERRKKDR